MSIRKKVQPPAIHVDVDSMPKKYVVAMRSVTMHSTDFQEITVWPGQLANEVAERVAQGYGATVVSLNPAVAPN